MLTFFHLFLMKFFIKNTNNLLLNFSKNIDQFSVNTLNKIIYSKKIYQVDKISLNIE